MALLFARRGCTSRATVPSVLQARVSRRTCRVQAASQEEVPQNVREARAWIAAWQQKQKQEQRPELAAAAQPSPASDDVPENVLEARAWIAAWQAKQAQETAGSASQPSAVTAAGQDADKVARDESPAPVVANNAVPTRSSGRWGTRMRDGSVMFTSQQLGDGETRQAALKTVGGAEDSGRR